MKEILSALERISSTGNFCAKYQSPMDQLEISVKNIGSIQWPLSQDQIGLLLKYASPAHFGRRDQTLLDKEVRHTSELGADQVEISEHSWKEIFQPALEQLKAALGLSEESDLTAELHNLLIYGPGQFFKPHQDSEKQKGMVASLVVVLPSVHRGGNLIIDHHGEKKLFLSSRFSLKQLTFIGFYADCYHEVKPVTEGYRVALTFNVILKPHAQKKNNQADNLAVHELTQALKKYFSPEALAQANNSYHGVLRFAYLLDHEYTQHSLSWRQLKNIDALRAKTIKAAADQLDLEASLALADIRECWQCEFDDSSYYCRYSDSSDYDDEAGEPVELVDDETVLKYWRDSRDQPLSYRDCYMPSVYIGWTKSTDDFKPFETEYEGYMGNYGNTMDRWYHRAAITLWRKKDHYRVLFDMDALAVVDDLFELAKQENSKEKLNKIFAALLPDWGKKIGRHKEAEIISKLCIIAFAMQNAGHAKALLSSFDFCVLSAQVAKELVLLEQAYGAQWLLGLFQAWGETDDGWQARNNCCEKLLPIVKVLVNYLEKDQELVIDYLFQYHFNWIKQNDKALLDRHSRAEVLKDQKAHVDRVLDFVASCILSGNQEKNNLVIDYVVKCTEIYSATELISLIYCFGQALAKSKLAQWHYPQLLQYVFNVLKIEQQKGLRKSDDWSIAELSNCHCDDCIELGVFLSKNNEVKKIWPLRKDRRAHMHQVIDQLAISVTHQTEHRGSPHKLVLEKTPQIHADAKRRYKLVLQLLDELEAMID